MVDLSQFPHIYTIAQYPWKLEKMSPHSLNAQIENKLYYIPDLDLTNRLTAVNQTTSHGLCPGQLLTPILIGELIFEIT